MDWNSNNPRKFHRFNPPIHPGLGDVIRTLAPWRPVGGSAYFYVTFFMGMGFIHYRFIQSSTANAVESNIPPSVDYIHRLILGALVGNQAKTIIN
jgi:hypothetical protein